MYSDISQLSFTSRQYYVQKFYDEKIKLSKSQEERDMLKQQCRASICSLDRMKHDKLYVNSINGIVIEQLKKEGKWKMDNLKVIDFKGQNVIESRMVAEMIEMRHTDLLRKIKGYAEILENAKLRSQNFFIPNTYKVDGNNKTYDCYLLTKQGCEMVANKLTGEKGVLFTAEYVKAFNEMEELAKTKELVSLDDLSKDPLKVLKLMFNANVNTDKKIDEVNEDLQYFKKDLPLLPVECDDVQKAVRQLGTRLLGGHGSPAYCDDSIRQKVYSDIGREIKHKFNVRSYKAIKRKYLDDVNRIIEHYECPIELLELIKEKNRVEES